MSVKVIAELIGKTFQHVEGAIDGDVFIFMVDETESYMFYHEPDCCEKVRIADIVGNLKDLENAPLVMAEEVTDCGSPISEYSDDASYTWTFYKFATVKGYVTVRWYGSSNGYYSETVDFKRVQEA